MTLGKKSPDFMFLQINNNSGTSDLPFATVEYALNNVASGDTVIMQPTYHKRVSVMTGLVSINGKYVPPNW